MAERGQAGQRILVVEDDDDARKVLLHALETGGYRAIGANTAVEALAMLREKQVCPSLILLDLFLPGISGWQFREEQCRDADLTSIPVILVSGYPHTLESVPPVGLIAGALSDAQQQIAMNLSAASGGKGRVSFASALVLPGIAAALLPNLTCPLCWPAYAGILSALGLGFLGTTAYLLPFTAAFLFVAVGALALGAKRHGKHGPLLVGFVGSAVVLLGKFVLGSSPATFAGIGMLIAASVWNARPRRAAAVACLACAPAGTGSTNGSATEVSS